MPSTRAILTAALRLISNLRHGKRGFGWPGVVCDERRCSGRDRDDPGRIGPEEPFGEPVDLALRSPYPLISPSVGRSLNMMTKCCCEEPLPGIDSARPGRPFLCSRACNLRTSAPNPLWRRPGAPEPARRLFRSFFSMSGTSQRKSSLLSFRSLLKRQWNVAFG